MYALPSRRVVRGNMKILMAIPLALIAAMYLLAGTESGQPKSSDPAAIAAALTADLKVREIVDQVVVTAPRVAPAALELKLDQPLVEVAVVATPPAVQRDPS